MSTTTDRPTDPHTDRPLRVASAPFLLMAAGYVVPFFGAGASIAGTVVLATTAGVVWPRRGRLSTTAAACAAFAATWFGVVLWFADVAPSWVPTRMVWLPIPLCGPTGAGWTVAPIASVATYAFFAWLSVRHDRPWLWPVGAVAATFLYEVAAGTVTGAFGGWQC